MWNKKEKILKLNFQDQRGCIFEQIKKGLREKCLKVYVILSW